MSFKYTSLVYEFFDNGNIDGRDIHDFLHDHGIKDVCINRLQSESISTHFIKVTIPGRYGKKHGGSAKTIGIVGRLGGVGARPCVTGLVSDADGAIATIASALKMADMQNKGDILNGDVILTTHVCPNAPIITHKPVDFMGSPISSDTENKHTVFPEMEAILSIDTTRGNRILNRRGFAITPTVKNGYILKVSDDALDIMSYVSGLLPAVLPITMQDITPYGNNIYHINSIMQPSISTTAPVIGVALTSETVIPGCCTGVSRIHDIEEVVRFVIEVAKQYGADKFSFYDDQEFNKVADIYQFKGFLK